MKGKRTVMIAAMLLTVGVVAGAAQHQWGFNATTGQGGVNRPDVEHALGYRVSAAEAQALVFTCVDIVDGCIRERRLRTFVRTGGNGQKVTGFWFFGYESEDSACGPPSASGTDPTLHVNGVPID